MGGGNGVNIQEVVYDATSNDYGVARIRSNAAKIIVLDCYSNLSNVACILFVYGGSTYCILLKMNTSGYDVVRNTKFTATMKYIQIT